MSEQTTSRFTSQKPEDIEWRVNVARVDATIEGMQRNPILAAYVEQMKAEGLSIAEQIKRLKEFDLTAATVAAE